MFSFMVCIVLAVAGIAAVSGFVIGRIVGYDDGWDARAVDARHRIADQELHRVTVQRRAR